MKITDFIVPHLRANIHLFVPHAAPTADSLRDGLAPIKGSPVWAAVNSNPIAPKVIAELWGRKIPMPKFDLEHAERYACTLTVTPRELDATDGGNFARIALQLDDRLPHHRESLKLVRQALPSEGEQIAGSAFRLPPYLSRLQSAWESAVAGKPYQVHTFFDSYLEDLSEAASLLVDRTVMKQRLPGLQAQADSDIRLRRFSEKGVHDPIAEVGLASGDGERMLELLKRGYPGRTLPGSIAGLHLILLRYPAAGPKAACWSRLQLLPDRKAGKIYVDPITWTDLQGGDTDGDLAFLLLSGATFGEVRPVGAFPRLTLNPSKG